MVWALGAVEGVRIGSYQAITRSPAGKRMSGLTSIAAQVVVSRAKDETRSARGSRMSLTYGSNGRENRTARHRDLSLPTTVPPDNNTSRDSAAPAPFSPDTSVRHYTRLSSLGFLE
jgi:hypothetical protein